MKKLQDFCNNEFGSGTIIALDDAPKERPHVSTGIWSLDRALGVGGLPLGGIIELFGPESSGKTSVLLSACKNCQLFLKRPVLFLDYENCFDPVYAQALGVDLSGDWFAVSQPDTLEQGISIAEKYIIAEAVGLIVVDSLAAMLPKAELEDAKGKERDIGDKVPMAAQGKAMADTLRRIIKRVRQSNVSLCFINQMREDIRAAQRGYIKRTTPGSKTLRYYALARIEFMKVEGIKGKIENPVTGVMEDGTVATVIEATVVKNKVAPPFRRCRFVMGQGLGYDEISTFIYIGKARGWIVSRGSWYEFPTLDGTQKLQGEEAVKNFYLQNPEHFQALKDVIINEVENAGLHKEEEESVVAGVADLDSVLSELDSEDGAVTDSSDEAGVTDSSDEAVAEIDELNKISEAGE